MVDADASLLILLSHRQAINPTPPPTSVPCTTSSPSLREVQQLLVEPAVLTYPDRPPRPLLVSSLLPLRFRGRLSPGRLLLLTTCGA